MAAGEMVHVSGMVGEILPNRMYRVRLENGDMVLATVAGRARRGLRIVQGDRVNVELSPYDVSRGRITGAAADTPEET